MGLCMSSLICIGLLVICVGEKLCWNDKITKRYEPQIRLSLMFSTLAVRTSLECPTVGEESSNSEAKWWSGSSDTFKSHRGNPTKFLAAVLLLHRGEAGLGRQNGRHFLQAWCQSVFRVIRVLQERRAPRVALKVFASKVDRARRHGAWQEVEHGVFLQNALGDEARQPHHPSVGVSGLEVSHEEAVSARNCHLELQRVENFGLHAQNLFLRVCLVSDVHEVTQLGRVNFFILGRKLKGTKKREKAQKVISRMELAGIDAVPVLLIIVSVRPYQESSDSHELKLGSLYLFKFEVAINHVDRQVKRLRHAAELLVHLNLHRRGNYEVIKLP